MLDRIKVGTVLVFRDWNLEDKKWVVVLIDKATDTYVVQRKGIKMYYFAKGIKLNFYIDGEEEQEPDENYPYHD